jgi:aldehyde:ferredoxin oxidoreductase
MFNRKLAIIDLSKEKVSVQDVPDSLKKLLLGGRGMNVYYLNKLLGKDVDPLSPDNVLILGTGFLTGTLAPNSGRFSTTAKSPESGFLGDTNCGGFFAPELRYAGFDRLIVLGKAKKPSYILAKDGEIEIRDAADYWGLDTYEVQKAFKRDLGPVESIVCGVPGEKLVRYACIRTGVKNAGGRTGLGCVMGSKNIKAVVASGTDGIEHAHPEEMLETVKELKEYILKSKISPILGSVGTPLLYEVSNAFGGIRTKNSQLNAWKDDYDAAHIEEKYVEKMISCAACIVHCRHRNTLGGEGPEYTSQVLVGANLGIEDLGDMIKLQNLVNQLGLDVSSTGTYLGWATEMIERGVLTKEKVGEDLRFGNTEAYESMIHKIANREGFGDVLAEGSRLVQKFGKETADYLIAVKGIPQSDPHDVRYMKAFALGIATSSRGADHLRSRPTLEIFFKLPHDVKEKIYGFKNISADPSGYEGKEKVVWFSENIFACIDCLGICKFICHGFNSPHFVDFHWMGRLIHAAAGWDEYDRKALQAVGKRVVDIERWFNYKQGMVADHDTLPARYFDEPSKLRTAKGHHIDRGEFAKMKARFYELHGWNKDGSLTEERKKELEAIQ